MAYKISGNISSDVRIIIFKEDNYTIESNNEIPSGSYEIIVNTGDKLIIARTDDGEIIGYGAVIPEAFSASGNNAVIGGGLIYTDSGVATDSISHLVISITSTAVDFGDLTMTRFHLRAVSNGSNDRCVFIAGLDSGSIDVNVMDYVTISTPGNATDFGDTTIAINSFGATSNGTNNRGVFRTAGKDAYIHYITISSASNSNTFGDRLYASAATAGESNGTNNRGVFAGGLDGPSFYNNIEYVTISSLGNAQEFGDLTQTRGYLCSVSNGTNNRGVFGGGYTGSVYSNVLDYITISSLGNASDFGDLTEYHHVATGTSNKTNNKGLIISGTSSNFSPTPHNIVEYITISTAGNASDFTELMYKLYDHTATSNA